MENAIIETDNEFRIRLENFIKKLSKQPQTHELAKTTDGKALYLPIDFVETQLDELFFGLWETKNFEWKPIANEITACIVLRVFHPTAKTWIERIGCASISVMVDKAPDNVTGQEKNRWALNLDNKKPNALDMGLPKLKADCIKNATLSLGNIFGRNINRTKKDVYTPILGTFSKPQLTQ